MSVPFTVVRLAQQHLAQAAELERLCFAEPWSETALRLYLTDGVAYAACDPSGRVLAYGGMLPSGDGGEIINLAVHPDFRRQGLGRAVLNALLEDADRRGLHRLALEVRVSNGAAIALYRSHGFAVAGLRRRFYSLPTEDAYTMIREAPLPMHERKEDPC